MANICFSQNAIVLQKTKQSVIKGGGGDHFDNYLGNHLNILQKKYRSSDRPDFNFYSTPFQKPMQNVFLP